MKKFLMGIIITFILLFSVNTVEALTYSNLPYEVRNIFESFMMHLDEGNVAIYNTIDTSNIELKESVDKYLGGTSIYYNISTVKELDEEHYQINAYVTMYSLVDNTEYNLTNILITFEIKLIEGEYKLVDTSLFWVLDEGIDLFIKILTIGFCCVFVVGVVITLIAIIFDKRKKKKWQQQNLNNSMYNQQNNNNAIN